MNNTKRRIVLAIIFLIFVTIVKCQFQDPREKNGACPPLLPVQICSRSCLSDSHCQGPGKCCPTSCGGFVCSRPVTMRQPQQIEKQGTCPATPAGPWVCSSTCTVDSDCKGTKKCCKNRCGAFACQNPEIEIINSVEIPFGSSTENPNDKISVQPYPYDSRFNYGFNPYPYPYNPYETFGLNRNPYNYNGY